MFGACSCHAGVRAGVRTVRMAQWRGVGVDEGDGARWPRVLMHPCSIILTCMHLVARGASGPMSTRMLGRHKGVSVRRSACAWPKLCYQHASAHGLGPYQRVRGGYRTRPAFEGCRPAGPRTARARAQDLAAWYLGVIGSVLSEFQAHVVFCQIKWTHIGTEHVGSTSRAHIQAIRFCHSNSHSHNHSRSRSHCLANTTEASG